MRMHGKPLVWIDCEMTGLDVEHDRILEIACLVTDGALRTVLEVYPACASDVIQTVAELKQLLLIHRAWPGPRGGHLPH